MKRIIMDEKVSESRRGGSAAPQRYPPCQYSLIMAIKRRGQPLAEGGAREGRGRGKGGRGVMDTSRSLRRPRVQIITSWPPSARLQQQEKEEEGEGE